MMMTARVKRKGKEMLTASWRPVSRYKPALMLGLEYRSNQSGSIHIHTNTYEECNLCPMTYPLPVYDALQFTNCQISSRVSVRLNHAKATCTVIRRNPARTGVRVRFPSQRRTKVILTEIERRYILS